MINISNGIIMYIYIYQILSKNAQVNESYFEKSHYEDLTKFLLKKFQ